MDDQNKNLILATVLSAAVIFVWYTFFTPPLPQPEPAAPAEVSATEPAAAPATAQATPTPEAAAAVAAARIDIDTPRLRGTLSLAGGRIDDLQLR
ncbi:MAG: membrane protein insertase YidC, partial [Rhodobacteraceae bacterium]|nr:membrane protein insertase YidC [Paracoccaceae bacterium]